MKKILFALTLGLYITAQAQILSTEKLWQMHRFTESALSPDGKNIAFCLKTYDVKANKGTSILYIQSASAKMGERKSISTAEANVFDIRWRPDGAKICFLSAKSGDVQLYEMNVDGSDIHQVSHVIGGINGYKYSPKMDKLAYTADVKLDKTVKDIYPDLDKCNARIIDGLFYRHWDAWSDYAYSHLFIDSYSDGKLNGTAVDIMLNEKFDCPLQPHGDDDAFNWSPNGRYLAYESRKENGTAEAISTNSDIYLYDLATGKTQDISAFNKGYDRSPTFSPDGSKLAWMQMQTPAYEADLNQLVYWDLHSDNANVNAFHQLKAQGEYSAEHFCWVNNSSILATCIVEGTKPIYLFENIDKSNASRVKISQQIADYAQLMVHDAKSPVFAARTSMSAPSDLVCISPAQKSEISIGDFNKDILNGLHMGKVEARKVKASDGKDILCWVIYPPDFDPTKKYPTLLYCQGGPQSPVSQFFSYRWNFQLMAAKGYIVIAPNRRGLPGFGKAWNDEIIGDYGGQCMRDYLSSIDDIAKEKYVDANRLGAVGASFGGYSVYWLAGHHEKRFKCFIAHCGMFNMESWYGSTEEMFFANNDSKGPYWSQTTHPNNFDASPHKFVQQWDAPILVIHNEKDFRVPLNQGMEAFTAAQMKGVPSRFLYFPDENHWVTKPQNSVLWQRVFFDWLDTYLK